MHAIVQVLGQDLMSSAFKHLKVIMGEMAEMFLSLSSSVNVPLHFLRHMHIPLQSLWLVLFYIFGVPLLIPLISFHINQEILIQNSFFFNAIWLNVGYMHTKIRKIHCVWRYFMAHKG